MWDAASNQYMSYVNGIGSNGGSRYIASSQGFWVRSTAASPILTAKETVKTTNNTAFKRETLPSNVLFVEVSEGTIKSNTAISFNSEASLNFDNNLDAEYFPGSSSLGICSHSSDLTKFYSINSLPDSSLHVPIWVVHGSTLKSRTLTFTNLDNFAPEDTLFLFDKYLRTATELYEGLTYTFTNDKKSASNGSQRFEIIRKRPENNSPITSLNQEKSISVELFPTHLKKEGVIEIHANSNGLVEVIITDLLGKTWVEEKVNLQVTNNIFAPNKSGLYLVHMRIGNDEIIKKILVD